MHLPHGNEPTSPTAPVALDDVIAAFQAANAHVSGGCVECGPAMRLPELCQEGRVLALAAVGSLAH
ncbi:hypothetical protein ACFT0G_25350 [Streptomyces sp. NPDC057020]|uniref:hypothetical protein n=1 Tax=unclassified Streptomyces TaxID=2593676 RepID=UPI00362EC993